MGITTWNGIKVDQWQNITEYGEKTNTYTFNVERKTGRPLYYEMMGYNTLLGSHYDKYYLKYTNFNTRKIPSTVFAIPKSKENFCPEKKRDDRI